MTQFTNIGAAFPLEKLGSDIARNEFNYQSILNGLIAWDKTTDSTVTIRLTKDSDPYYEDYTIPSKSSIFDLNTLDCTVTGSIQYKEFAIDCILDSALYGGSFIFDETTFDAELNVNITDNEITITSATAFFKGDTIIFETIGTLPTGLDANEQYIIKEKLDNVITLYESDGETEVDITAVGSGSVTVIKLTESPETDTTDPGDIATLRISVANAGNADWELCYYQLIRDWESSHSYKFGNLVLYSNKIYKVLTNISSSSTTPFYDHAHYELLIKEWVTETSYNAGDLVYYNDVLYMATETIPSRLSITSPDNAVTVYKEYAKEYVSGTTYNGGEYVFYNGNAYISNASVVNSTATPDNDTESWELAVILPVPTIATIKQSNIAKWYLDVDIAKFIMRNMSSNSDDSTSDTDISIKLSVKTKEPASIYQRSVDVISTSNYAFWPNDKTSIWDVAKPLSESATNTELAITQRQDYSAVMMFDHTNANIAKTVNFVNYDGPDLDQGLCVYLPVEVPVGESCISIPEDGFTYEFYFRIWPNADLTSAVTRDHIINKAQIYVYSSPTLEDVENNNCGTPIAKFSMARVTNFYVFGENIAIPDKPVCYRATFIYSKIENKWITLDYYQLPDHIFMGPIGFIDPRNPANLDLNNSVIGNINPNAANIGYETGAFPLYQDPFSNPDLSPFRISDDSQYDSFINRIS